MGETSERLLELKLTQIRLDGGTQSRASLDSGVVSEYEQAIRNLEEFPPVVVFYDGSHYWLASGFHRWHGHHKAGRKTIRCRVVDGTVRDAILYSVATNAEHGKRRSSEDIRHAVRLLLTDPEWAAWSNNEIARRCRTNAHLVADEKKVMREEAEQERKREEARKQAEAAKVSPTALGNGTAAGGWATGGSKPAPAPATLPAPQPVTYSHYGTVKTMDAASIGKNPGKKAGNNIRPVVIETEPKELAKLAVKEKRSGVKYVKQVKAQGKDIEYLIAEVKRIWEEIPVAED